MHSRAWHEDDDALLAELRNAMAEVDDEEARLRAAAVAAFTWRNVDEELELLSLSHDSLLADAAFRGAADTATPRVLVFDNEQTTLELQVSEDLLMGQVLPGRAGSIAVDGPQGTVAQAQADDSGFFQLPRPPAGTIRLRLEGPPGLVTDWLSL